ncbi:facilitated trehalose transporter Tret1-like [Spodoptera litura]|uniref:Facilitated trehalose transporter Tret1-like n=1 Tax=Spodoptera litura TaxID=69820 RepID=A0A9J7IZZ2_SPOLT|nr:facilitated trehalose transporter Tret1-like [Spodoptera litura]XP_022831117.1 facilitated trehalose transporter Tret1-like [Spodoptera litura]XP_022831118.1 facilitated trehalose transporter Tret1-like [Spodoptera litura]XP_022831119.1 facilitated trehalose transporter Tret1-like [Spodoptera litura]XP_022831120.1 facilitated trehalose transporter Tret1-like [Spodoptera litura]
MENGNRKKLYLVTLSVSMAMMTLGVSSAWPTPVLPKFKNNETNVDINAYEMSTMLAVNPIGFAVGTLATGYLADRFGRRATILGSAIPIALGSIIVVFALKAWLLCITSFSWSCGTGMVSTVSNYYLSEIADKDVRGTLAVITGFMFKFGTLLTMILGPFLPYETLNQVMLVLPFLFCAMCYWIPETPYFLLKNNNLEGARSSLRILRGYKDEKVLEDELLALQANVRDEMRHSTSVKELFTGGQYRRAIIISVGLKLTQMMTGAVVIRQYLGWIIEETKSDMKTSLALIIYGAVSFVVGMMSSVLVDRVGRRPLLIFSYIGTGVSLGAVGVYFFMQEVLEVTTSTLATVSFIPLLGIILANVISTVGFNSLIYIIPAEIFPINIKAIAITCLNLFSAALGFGLGLGYQRVKDLCGLTTVFWIFAAFAFGGGVFSYIFVMETKRKDLREIQAELQGDKYNVVPQNDKLESTKTKDESEEATELKELKS